MQFEKKAIVFAVLIALSIIAWSFFLNSTGLTIEKIIQVESIEENALTLISPAFLLFILLLPLTPALIFSLAVNSNEKQTMISSTSGSILGIAISVLLFANVQAFFIAMLFLIIGSLLAVKTAFVRLSELKKQVWFRVSGETSQKLMSLVGVGLLIGTALFVIQNQEKVIDNLEQGLLEKAFGIQGSKNIVSLRADTYIEANKQMLEQLTALPEYQKLKESQDTDVSLFVTKIELLKDNIDNPIVREQLIQQIKQDPNFQSLRQNVSFDFVKQQFPMLQTMEEFYWIIAAMVLFGVFMALANLVIVPLSILYSLMIAKTVQVSLGLEEKTKAKKEAEKKTLKPLEKTTSKT